MLRREKLTDGMSGGMGDWEGHHCISDSQRWRVHISVQGDKSNKADEKVAREKTPHFPLPEEGADRCSLLVYKMYKTEGKNSQSWDRLWYQNNGRISGF